MAITLNRGFTKIDVGQAQKETTINDALDNFDSRDGVLSKPLAGGAVTLTAGESLNGLWVFTGTLTSNATVRFPSNTTVGTRCPLVVNATSGAFTLTVAPASGGTGVSVTQGKSKFLYFDGTNVAEAVTETSGAGGAGSAVGLGLVDFTGEVTVTGASTLTSTAYYKPHKCVDSGTPADYTVTLPAPAAGDVGKLIFFRADGALTKLVTLDAGPTRTVDGQQTRVMWAGESCALLCVGTSGLCWQKIAGKSVAMHAQMYMSANQSVATATYPPASALAIDTVTANVGSLCSTGAHTITIRRAGTYRFAAQAYHDCSGGATQCAVYVFKTSVSGTLVYSGVEAAPGVTGQISPQAEGFRSCAAGDVYVLGAYQNSGGSRNVVGDPVSQLTFLSVEEILQW